MSLSFNSKLSRSPFSCSSSSISASLDSGSKLLTEKPPNILRFDHSKERIKKLFDKVELSISAYDTAWVAMVPTTLSSSKPCFPECLNWLLDNQHLDGSWGLHHDNPSLTKDALLSTLACVLALKRWGIGERHITKGLRFIELNFASIFDENQVTPVGFDIIFPGMTEFAKDLKLNLPVKSTETDAMVIKRDLELNRFEGNLESRNAYLAYVSEAMLKQHNCEEAVQKYRNKNGSLFNSPSTTAAALTQIHNAGYLSYLQTLVKKFGNAVPTVYPLDIYTRLCMVDSLEGLGIARFFAEEIRSVLDETYRLWLQEDEEIFIDLTTCAMAFRLLRINGYDVSSDVLTKLAEEARFIDSSEEGYLKDIEAALELFKASDMILYQHESSLRKHNLRASRFLKMQLSNSLNCGDDNNLRKHMSEEVNDALQIPYYMNLDRLAHRRKIEHYSVDNTKVSKTSYRIYNINNADFLKLAVDDFNTCQSMHREELELLGRWVVDNKLDKLKFARQKLAYCYFSAAATLFSPDVSDARISWAKNGVLTTVVDDFFDVGGSEQELLNLVQLVEKWDVNGDDEYCSEQVEIIFSALRSTILEIGDKAYNTQGRNVTSHVIEIWLALLKSMLQEAEWSRNKTVPTLEEYMENGFISFALGPIVLPALYLVGPRLSNEVVNSAELKHLYKLMSTCGRLQNDIQGFKRESEEGKLNVVSLHMIHSDTNITKHEIVTKLNGVIDGMKRELMRLVLREEGSVVPRACKDLFWKMNNVLHLFYMNGDGFTSHDMFKVVNDVLRDPLDLS